MNEDEQQTVKDIICYLCSFLDERPKIEFRQAAELDKTNEINITAANPEQIIGTDGEALLALQHLVRIFFKKHTGSTVRFHLDVNNFQRERRDYLKELAISTARRVSEENRLVVLKPMNAFERRLVHLALADYSGVNTESLGEMTERRVIVKPLN
ncbi:protein jag [Patescibacteria group bacterium]